MSKRDRFRKGALYLAMTLAVVLLVLDRSAAWIHRPDADSTAVVIYTTAWCPFCRQLRAYLDANNIPYRDYDVEKSIQGGMGFWTLRGRGVPVSVIGPEIIYGFDMDRISRTLAGLGYKVSVSRDNRMADTDAVKDGGVAAL